MKKKHFIFLLSIIPCFTFYICLSQTHSKTDSLEKLLEAPQLDTVRVYILNQLSLEYISINTEKSLQYSKQALSLSTDINFIQGIASSLNNMGTVYQRKGDYNKALNYYRRTLEKYKKLFEQAQRSGNPDAIARSKKGIASGLGNIGEIHRLQGNYAQAIDPLFKSLKMRKELGDKKGIISSLDNIGAVFWTQGNYKAAREYFSCSLKRSEELGNSEGTAASLTHIGHIYTNESEYVKALDYFQQALKLYQQIGNKNKIAKSLINIGRIYGLKGNLEKAKYYFSQSLEIAKELNDKESVLYSLNNIGAIYRDKSDYAQALRYAKRSLIIAKEMGLKKEILNVYNLFTSIYVKQKNYKNAYEYLQLYSEMKDSILNEHNNKIIAEIQTKYESERKEQENIILKKEINARKHKQYALTIVLLLVLILIGVLLKNHFNYKKRKKAETDKLLSEMKLLKAGTIVKKMVDSTQKPEVKINRENVNDKTESRLNETDWNVLDVLYQNPIAANKQIAIKVFLSVEGVRSSLKKMYKLFDIQKSTENQKIALVIKVMKISSNLD